MLYICTSNFASIPEVVSITNLKKRKTSSGYNGAKQYFHYHNTAKKYESCISKREKWNQNDILKTDLSFIKGSIKHCINNGYICNMFITLRDTC